MDKTQIAVAVFDKCAQLYQDRFMDLDLYHDTFDLFCENIPRADASILELACGPGNITRYLLKQRPDFRILGLDLAPNMIELARINNPGTEFQIMDCREISGLGRKFDAIMSGFYLPYLPKEDAEKFITDAKGLLCPGGLLYLSTMEDDYTKSGFKKGSTGDEIFIHYHEAEYLVRALEENSFNVVDIRRKDFPTNDGTKVTDLVTIARRMPLRNDDNVSS